MFMNLNNQYKISLFIILLYFFIYMYAYNKIKILYIDTYSDEVQKY